MGSFVVHFRIGKEGKEEACDYLERQHDDGCSYSRRKHGHSETWSPACASWSACFRPAYRSHCPSPCPPCPSPWLPREASPPTFAPCWRIQGRRSRRTSSSGVESYPTSSLSFHDFLSKNFLPFFLPNGTIARQIFLSLFLFYPPCNDIQSCSF